MMEERGSNTEPRDLPDTATHAGSRFSAVDPRSSIPEPRSSVLDPRSSVPLYGSQFWIAYAANLLLVTGNTLIFRFADFVKFLDGSAIDAGLIVGIGTGVSVLVRVWLGRLIDQQGPRHVWIVSATALVASLLGFACLNSLGPQIYLLRMVYSCSIAGAFSCSMIHLCTDVPVTRRAELIGTLGTSGFLGMMLGPQIGDWMFPPRHTSHSQYVAMFLTAAAFCVGYCLLVVYLSRHSARPTPHEPPPLGRLLVEYWPGMLLPVAMMMGMAQVVPSTFLTLFRDHLDLDGIGVFFWFYAPIAIVMRLIGRRWPEQLGRRAAALIGLVLLAVSMPLYLIVRTQWQLAWAALAAGTGHALLFPSVATLGAESFPERYRATGTTLILGFVDLGTLCGAPALGAIIDHVSFDAMFWSASGVLSVVALSFAGVSLFQWRRDAAQLKSSAEVAEDMGGW